MFSAAMVYSCPDLKLSIYSTCKRISHMLLQNIKMFLGLIYLELKTPKMKEIRANCEEIFLQGEEGVQDLRVCRSFPSKVSVPPQARASSSKVSVPPSGARVLLALVQVVPAVPVSLLDRAVAAQLG
jgi:hypothetical protein